MEDSQIVGYVGIPEIHDAKIVSISHNGDKTSVTLQSLERHAFTIEFEGVASIKSNRPEGMMLYALTEMSALAPLRRFVFANWDEEDDASLEVLAQNFSVDGIS